MNVVIKGNDSLIEAIKQHYYEDIDVDNKVPYTKFVVTTKDFKVIAYETNKIMFQGKDANYQASLWSDTLLDNQKENGYEPIHACKFDDYIGSDEVGTGDYFGPVVVCSAYVSRELLNSVAHLNLTDSKTYTDAKIKELAAQLKPIIPHYLYILDNEKYNKNQPTNNSNMIKAKMHNYAIAQCLKIVNKKVPVILDQFCQPKTYYSYLVYSKTIVEDIIFETKAESKYIGVAIASIIARDAFLEEMEKLGKSVETTLQKGAGALVDEQAVELVNKYGIEILAKIAKLHFANTLKIKNKLKQ